MEKYILYPGYVLDDSNNGRHYVFAYELVKLYGVKWSECIVCLPGKELMKGIKKCLISLHPRSDGNYELKEDGLSDYTFSSSDWKIL